MKVLSHTWFMVVRQARNLMREPIWIALLLIQPMIWLLLYGQLFSRVPALRGGADTYIEFLTPGIVIMKMPMHLLIPGSIRSRRDAAAARGVLPG